MATSYSDKLKDPRWQRKRLEILQRDDFTCTRCEATDKTLHVHHGYYERGLEPWEYPDKSLHTLCEDCHADATEIMATLARIIGNVPQFRLETFRNLIAYMVRQGNLITDSEVRDRGQIFRESCSSTDDIFAKALYADFNIDLRQPAETESI